MKYRLLTESDFEYTGLSEDDVFEDNEGYRLVRTNSTEIGSFTVSEYTDNHYWEYRIEIGDESFRIDQNWPQPNFQKYLDEFCLELRNALLKICKSPRQAEIEMLEGLAEHDWKSAMSVVESLFCGYY